MLLNLTFQQLAFVVILLVAFGLLLTERLRNDLVAVLIIVALYATGVLGAREALAGFSSEPAIVVAAIFVLSGALHQTGLSDTLGAWVGRLAGQGYGRAIAVIMPAVALLSAFTHHLTTTALMLPITINLARERNIAPSKLLMPMAIAASLGTTITIIGAPAFIIASAVLQQAGRPGLGIFSIAPIGLALSAVGTLAMLLLGRWLLPDRGGGDDPTGRFRLDDYFTELRVLETSPLVDLTVGAVRVDERSGLNVVGVVRDGRQLPRPLEDHPICAGDVLLLRTSPDKIMEFRQETGVELQAVAKYGDLAGDATDDQTRGEELVQAIVAPSSDLVGRTIRAIDFRRRYGALVVSIWRRNGWLDRKLAEIQLRAGDVLVLHGSPDALERVRTDPSFLLLTPFQGETRLRRKARLAGAIMLATVLLAALNIFSIEMAALAGAAAMVLSGCLTPRQAYRAIDARIFVFIAGALPLGAAMQSTGVSTLIAGWLQRSVGQLPEMAILLLIFAIVALLTQFMSDAATTAVFAPVAVALAQALGHAPEAYAVTVAMAAVASFLTPIGHHGNLLIYGPGNYQFGDFVRVGAPLTLVIALVVAGLAPLLWAS